MSSDITWLAGAPGASPVASAKHAICHLADKITRYEHVMYFSSVVDVVLVLKTDTDRTHRPFQSIFIIHR